MTLETNGLALGANPISTIEIDELSGLDQRKDAILSLRKVSVNYGPVQALSDVDLDIHPGSIHAIIGENGAGKSTLLKAIAGIRKPSTGHLEIEGEPCEFSGAQQAQAAGISCVFQEMSLIPDLSIAENILLLNPPRRFGIVNRTAQKSRVAKLLDRVGAGDLDPATMVRDLPLSKKQLVEIAKGLAFDPRLLILDESTSALTNQDTKHILELVRALRDDGLAILYVSHRMSEIRTLADECSVFRDGRKIKTFAADTQSDSDIVEMMLGRSIEAAFPPKSEPKPDAPVVIETRDLAWDQSLTDISATVRKGEILGIGGLDGQGQHDFLLALFGVLKGLEGEVHLAGEMRTDKRPSHSIRSGPTMAYVPEDRGVHGLVQQMSVGENILLVDKGSYLKNFLRPKGKDSKRLQDAIERLKIKVTSHRQPVFALSGGNQQKVVLAKWLSEMPDILLLDDPTRGIDVGTKQEIFLLLNELAQEGCTILLYSSDYQELSNCCHRVLVFYEGKISHQLEGDMLTENNLINAAFNLPLQTP